MVGKEDFLHTSTCLLRPTGEGIAKQVRIAALAWVAGDNQHTLVRFLYGRCFREVDVVSFRTLVTLLAGTSGQSPHKEAYDHIDEYLFHCADSA